MLHCKEFKLQSVNNIMNILISRSQIINSYEQMHYIHLPTVQRGFVFTCIHLLMCWLVGYFHFHVGLFVVRFGWWFGLLSGLFVGWMVGWMVGWLVGWLVCCRVCLLVGWSFGWLVGWMVGLLSGLFVSWMVGWLVLLETLIEHGSLLRMDSITV